MRSNHPQCGLIGGFGGTIAPMPAPAPHAVTRTDLPLAHRREGKVRDIYDLDAWGDPPRAQSAVLLVATDRLSAFDVVLPTPITGKGALLTRMSLKWFEWIERKGLAHTHVLSGDARDVPGLSAEQRAQIEGRCVIGRRCEIVPVECVVRGYLEGSGWKDYKMSGSVCGVTLPAGLRQGDKLPEAIFTPATKAQVGEHDENISFARASEAVGADVMETLRATSLSIYKSAHEYALGRGVILADTKFEFGFEVDDSGARTGRLQLADEALTPDSSRFWARESWAPGREQVSFDKQYVREYLQSEVDAGRWDKAAPGIALPDEVVAHTVGKYEEAFRRLFG